MNNNRNDECWCGSGLKYKKCHLEFDEKINFLRSKGKITPLKRMIKNAKQIEGNNTSTWILMDYEDIIVHLFSKEDRLFYDLERIWRDGKIIEM